MQSEEQTMQWPQEEEEQKDSRYSNTQNTEKWAPRAPLNSGTTEGWAVPAPLMVLSSKTRWQVINEKRTGNVITTKGIQEISNVIRNNAT